MQDVLLPALLRLGKQEQEQEQVQVQVLDSRGGDTVELSCPTCDLPQLTCND